MIRSRGIAIAAFTTWAGLPPTALAGAGIAPRSAALGCPTPLGATRTAWAFGTAAAGTARLGAACTALTARPSHRTALGTAGTTPHAAAGSRTSPGARTSTCTSTSTSTSTWTTRAAARPAWAALRERGRRSGDDDGGRDRISQNSLHGISSW
ncbi:hypothetical protein SAMN05216360_106112 [Methylobacterium phyllostachyos]|uniref:Secreted protein n=1 Tax=Methylobacterium phyllostachyos TaxID=582672 RepID=A0A1G9Z4L4_9HYPH|nr:hypothetical protein SAMN05216360_106112 [Methylobacterium phyllostachyos]